MKTRKAGMDYGTYKAMMAAKGMTAISEDEFKALPIEGEDDDEGGGDAPGGDGGGDAPTDGGGDEGGGDDDGDDDDGDDDDAEKSVALSDLRKSMDAFDGVAAAANTAVGGSRETYLKARLDNGTITKSEREELGRIWAGTAENPTTDAAGRPLRKGLVQYLDPEDQEVVNAAPLLKGLLGGVQDRLDAVTTRTEAGLESVRQFQGAQGQLLKSLCGAILDMGDQLRKRDEVIKALSARLGIVEKTPAQPRAVKTAAGRGQPRPLNKSVSGGAPGDNGGVGGSRLQKSQVVRGFHTLVKAASDGNDFGTAQRLTEECAAFERTGRLSPGTRAAVEAVAG